MFIEFFKYDLRINRIVFISDELGLIHKIKLLYYYNLYIKKNISPHN